MRSTLSLIRREFTAYFLSPIAYVVLTVFLLGTGALYSDAFTALTKLGPRGAEYPMEVIFGGTSQLSEIPIFWLVFLFVPPLLTMRLFAEERSTGTMEALMTAPIKDWQIVLAKFIACFAFYLLMWLPTLAYLPVLMDLKADWNFQVWTPYSIVYVAGAGIALLGLLTMPFGWVGRGFLIAVFGAALAAVGGCLHYTKDANHILWLTARVDPWPVLTSYIGVIAVGVMFIALGMFVSSLVKGQMIAAIISISLGLNVIGAGKLLPSLDVNGTAYGIVSFVAVPQHFSKDFTRGVIDTRHLVFYLSAGLVLLYLTVRSVEAKRR